MGGSAQLAVLELIDDRGALALVIVTGLTINARLLTYSASMAREWAGTSRRFRLVAAASVIDPTWALATQRIERGGSPAARRAYYVAMATVLCVGWTAIVTVGAIAGPSVDLASMDVAVPLCLSVLVLPTLRSRSGAVLVAVAAIVGWFAADAPAGTGVLIASVVAVVAAGAADAVDGANAGSTHSRGPEEEP
jgi:predicted branched-subunit amino acid permease